MTYDEFKQSLAAEMPPETLSELQLALWHAGKGNWEQSHNIAQQHEGEKKFDRLHAYLHRVEGDEANAGYWYSRSGTSKPVATLQEEYEMLLKMWL